MNDFKKDFELRRNILGLTSIISTQQLPDLVNQKLPDVMNQLTLLAIKMQGQREKILKEDEDHLKHGFDDGDSDDDDDIDGDDDEEGMDSDEEFKKQQKIFATVGAKLHTGKALTKEEMKEVTLDGGLDDYDDEDDDSDYEFGGGDMDLYDSKLEDLDELKNL